MKHLYDELSLSCSMSTTKKYSTSFSLGTRALASQFRGPIHSVYGFVRLADEIVDSFHGFEQRELLEKFEADTWDAIEHKISLNPILNSFQKVYREFGFEKHLVEAFLKSMAFDLDKTVYSDEEYSEYIFGSAEAVGLMCLRVFVKGDDRIYANLKPYAQALGSAFQKVNFLRDLQADFEVLGRTYFPNAMLSDFTSQDKIEIEADIQRDFEIAKEGISMLPKEARFGVFVAYQYYLRLFKQIQKTPAKEIRSKRIRVPNGKKYSLFFTSYLQHRLNRF